MLRPAGCSEHENYVHVRESVACIQLCALCMLVGSASLASSKKDGAHLINLWQYNIQDAVAKHFLFK